MKKISKKRLWPLLAAAFLALICAVCIYGYKSTAGLLASQRAAERWRGDNETAFAQVSCFMPSGGSISEEQIYTFRKDMLTKLTEASFEVSADTTLIHDAWCSFGKVNVANGQRKGEVSVTAVGGNFFDFHPIKLVSGNYIHPADLMKDRVLLDTECAWLLFGGMELEGLSFNINGQPFVVAGVIEREEDRFSERAYTDGMGIYMSWDAYKALNEKAAISCYELVMAEPVQGFVYSAAKEKFPLGQGELVDNTYRYEAGRLLRMMKEGSSRSMHLGSAVYPYWENAARGTEDICLAWLVAAMVTAAMPLVLILFYAISILRRGHSKLRDDYVPQVKEKLSESYRIRARKRWEKKHPGFK